ncbi:MAG: sugar phosphate isomerase/epimerase [Candidatus Hydrogenedentes bacterium]|nr:sugar phosphate isomerase/epimerase [Candidatus Hydrogenedentota bacterium]
MYLSIRDAMIAGGDFETPVAGLRHLGIDAVEIRLDDEFRAIALDSPDSYVLYDATEAQAYRSHLDGLGIRCCSLLTARDLSVGKQDEHVEWLKRAVETAGPLGCDSIRIDSMLSREKDLAYGFRVELFCSVLGEVIQETGTSAVALAIENHGVAGNSLGFLLHILEEVDSDRLGLTLDTANFYWRGYPLSEVYGILKLLAPYARHTHVKNIAYPPDKREVHRDIGWEYGTYTCPMDEGDIDHGRVLRLLAGAGYSGDVCIENESLEKFAPGAERIRVLERDAAHVRELIASCEQRGPDR